MRNYSLVLPSSPVPEVSWRVPAALPKAIPSRSGPSASWSRRLRQLLSLAGLLVGLFAFWQGGPVVADTSVVVMGFVVLGVWGYCMLATGNPRTDHSRRRPRRRIPLPQVDLRLA